jgi:hypothetical protein
MSAEPEVLDQLLVDRCGLNLFLSLTIYTGWLLSANEIEDEPAT